MCEVSGAQRLWAQMESEHVSGWTQRGKSGQHLSIPNALLGGRFFCPIPFVDQEQKWLRSRLAQLISSQKVRRRRESTGLA